MKKILVFVYFITIVTLLSSCSLFHKHEFGEWQTENAPDCVNEGLDARYCECGEKETRAVAALGHTEKVITGYASSCSKTGLTDGKYCTVCRETIVEQETIAKAPHTEVIDYGRPATCANEGLTDGKHCEVCGKVTLSRQVIPKLPHNETVYPASPPTCVDNGRTEGKHCAVCGEVLVSPVIIDKLGHSVVVIPAIPATLTSDGRTEGKYCSTCGEVLLQSRSFPLHEHSYGDWSVSKYASSKNEGTRVRCCEICDIQEFAIIDKIRNDGSLGSAAKISDRTVIVSIFANDSGTSWDFNSSKDIQAMNVMHNHLSSAVEWLETQCKSYGASTEFIYDWKLHTDLFYSCSFSDFNMVREDGSGYYKQRSYIIKQINAKELKQKYNAQNILYIVYFNADETNTINSWSISDSYKFDCDVEIINMFTRDLRSGRSFFNSASAFAHEILHTFGAPDLYYSSPMIPQAYVDHCKKIKSKDIMYTTNLGSIIDLKFTELCAYYVGLVDSCEDVKTWNLGISSHLD